MDHQDSINICVFEQSEELLFSDLSGPLRTRPIKYMGYPVLFQVRPLASAADQLILSYKNHLL